MAAPRIIGVAFTTEVTNTTTHTLTVPAGLAADVGIFIFFGKDGSTDNITTPTGFTLLSAEGHGGGRHATFYKKATGSEGATIAVTTGTAEASASCIVLVGDWEDPATQAPNSGKARSTTAAATADLPNVTVTGGPKEVLSLLHYNIDGGDQSPNTYPSGWATVTGGPVESGANSNHVGCEVLQQAMGSVSAVDPGALTFGTSASWGGSNVLIHPGSLAPDSTTHTFTYSETQLSGGISESGNSSLTHVIDALDETLGMTETGDLTMFSGTHTFLYSESQLSPGLTETGDLTVIPLATGISGSVLGMRRGRYGFGLAHHILGGRI